MNIFYLDIDLVSSCSKEYSGNKANLINILRALYTNRELQNNMIQNCFDKEYMTIEKYYQKLLPIYKGEI